MGHKMVNGIEVPLTAEEEIEFAEMEKAYLEKVKEETPFIYRGKRLVMYNERGVTTEARLDALWEKIVENRPQEADRLQVIREQVKSEEPKPA